jgi:nucleoside-diphosphate-sugar epimerase
MAETSRFLVTGAKGCIGAWIIKNLVDQGAAPWVFDVDEKSHRLEALLSPNQMDQIHFIRGDIRRTDDVDRTVGDHGITHILHLAGLQVPACAANPPLGAEVNVVGTLNVFEAARRRRDTVKYIVYASSAAALGPEEFYGGMQVGEHAALRPSSHYGAFKQCNEENARIYFETGGISSCGLRPWAVYGAGRDQGMTSAPTKAIKSVMLDRPYTIHFTGRFDMQYVDDVARIFLRCAEASPSGAHVYSLRGAVIQMDDFIKALEQVRPGAHRLVHADGKQLPVAPDLDDSALVRDVGEIPRTPLPEGIRETLRIFEGLQRAGRLDTSDLSS